MFEYSYDVWKPAGETHYFMKIYPAFLVEWGNHDTQLSSFGEMQSQLTFYKKKVSLLTQTWTHIS